MTERFPYLPNWIVSLTTTPTPALPSRRNEPWVPETGTSETKRTQVVSVNVQVWARQQQRKFPPSHSARVYHEYHRACSRGIPGCRGLVDRTRAPSVRQRGGFEKDPGRPYEPFVLGGEGFAPFVPTLHVLYSKLLVQVAMLLLLQQHDASPTAKYAVGNDSGGGGGGRGCCDGCS